MDQTPHRRPRCSVLLAGLLALLAGCGSEPMDQAVIGVWHVDVEPSLAVLENTGLEQVVRSLEGSKTWTITPSNFKTVVLLNSGRELIYDYRYQPGDLEEDRIVLKCEVEGGVSPVTLYRKDGTMYVKERDYDLALKKVR